jgi:hypothetical protein
MFIQFLIGQFFDVYEDNARRRSMHKIRGYDWENGLFQHTTYRFSAMGRRALTEEEKKAKRKAEHQRFISNADSLDKKRERDRVKMQQRRQREAILTAQDRLALLADEETLERMMQQIVLEDRTELFPSKILVSSERSVEPAELDIGGFGEDDGAIIDTQPWQQWGYDDKLENEDVDRGLEYNDGDSETGLLTLLDGTDLEPVAVKMELEDVRIGRDPKRVVINLISG